MIDPTDPMAQDGMPMRHPTLDPGNWFGTTYFGEDVFAQFVNGLQATFFVGFLGGGLAALIGMAIGFVAGYRGGWIDEIPEHDHERLPGDPDPGRPARDHVLSAGSAACCSRPSSSA